MAEIQASDLVDLVGEILGLNLSESSLADGKPAEDTSLRQFEFDSLPLLEFAIRLEEMWGVSFNPADFQISHETTLRNLASAINDVR